MPINATDRIPTVLVVEDNPADTALIRYAFKRIDRPLDLTYFTGGSALLAHLEHGNSRPDCLLLDLSLPGMSGIELLKAIREREGQPYFPIIIFSASTHPKDLQEAYARRANAFVQKPMNLEEMISTIDNLISFWCGSNILP